MQRQKVWWTVWLMASAILVLLINGCAAGTGASQPRAAASGKTELMLLRAGFESVPNEHPKCAKVCQNLIPGQIVPHRRGSTIVYSYLSPETGRFYVGTAAEYQNFVNLSEERQPPTLGNESTDPEFWNIWQDMYSGR
ncbi:MAG: hypothetical protein M1438_14495 [Deltaproteobacteria bacterium]|nr:hypothetical protein [Deltaproteobacteria bacterium]